jgi:hypothetical protein
VGYANFPLAYTPEVMREAGVTSYLHTGLGPHNVVVGTLAELGLVGLVLLGLFLVPLVVNRGWGPDAATVRASIASLLVVALFLDVVGNRKQVWLMIGLAAGLQYLARREASSRASPMPGATTTGGRPHAPLVVRRPAARGALRSGLRRRTTSPSGTSRSWRPATVPAPRTPRPTMPSTSATRWIRGAASSSTT